MLKTTETSVIIVLVLVTTAMHSTAAWKVDCRKFVFAPQCRGVSAKRALVDKAEIVSGRGSSEKQGSPASAPQSDASLYFDSLPKPFPGIPIGRHIYSTSSLSDDVIGDNLETDPEVPEQESDIQVNTRWSKSSGSDAVSDEVITDKYVTSRKTGKRFSHGIFFLSQRVGRGHREERLRLMMKKILALIGAPAEQ